MGLLEPILMPTIVELQTINGQDPNPNHKPKIITALKMLTTLFQVIKWR